jgi:hypothetical protein
VPEPEDARGAIALGLKLYNAGKHQAALDLFAKALELPGTGLKRFRCNFLRRTCLQALARIACACQGYHRWVPLVCVD